jgi:16S rRNA (cytosine1402-N4)-methyltransferase
MEALKEGMQKAFECLSTGGRLAVITFHSLEDKIVKQYFKSLQEDGVAKLVNKKPIAPERDEVLQNPRSRSSKLRIITKI